MNVRRVTWFLLAATAACGDSQSPDLDPCGTVSLPLSGSATAPTVTDVTLEAHSYGVVLLATATDPQGSDDLYNVPQTIRIFRDNLCEAAPLARVDDLSGSGVEESFGTAVDATTDAALFAAISAAQMWPVELSFSDLEGNMTEGRVLARVVLDLE